MKISTCTLKLFTHFGGQAGMEILSKAGFEAIDYSIGQLKWNDPLMTGSEKDFAAYHKQLGTLAKAYGLEIFQSHSAFPSIAFQPETDPAMHRSTMRYIYAAGYMGCPNIVFHPVLHPDFDNGQNSDVCKQTNLAFFSALVPAAKDTGVTVCIENMFRGENGKPKIFNACSDAEQLIDLIDTLNGIHGPHFAACLDTGHATVVGQDPAAMLRKLGKRARVLHIHDNDGIFDQHWLPGEGVIDWDDVIRALNEIDYTGTFNTEASIYFNKVTQLDVSDTATATNMCKQLYTLSRSLADQVN